MADPSRLHAYAIRDLIRAALPIQNDVLLANVDKDDSLIAWPYIVVWPPPARRPVDSLDGYSAATANTRTQITGAGTTPDEVLAILDRAGEALHGVTPTIAGRGCGQIRMLDEEPGPIVRDPQVRTTDGHEIFTGNLTFELFSVAA